MKIFTAVIILAASVTPLAAQWIDHPTPGIPRTANGKPNLTAPAPRTADGKIDLSGLWQWLSPDQAIGNVSLRKPGDLQPADIQPWVQALIQQRAENFLHLRCRSFTPVCSSPPRIEQCSKSKSFLPRLPPPHCAIRHP